MDEIIVKNLSKSYDGSIVFKNLNLKMQCGQISCIMAPSGAGKTTLLRILMGLERADSGSITGLENKRFGAVFQEERLCEYMTATENIRLVTPQLEHGAVLREMDRLALENCDHQPVSELSGGMRRRVSILRALMAEYDILFLDEPFKGLDDALKKRVIVYVKEKTRGKTVVFVTHDRQEALLMGAEMIELKLFT